MPPSHAPVGQHPAWLPKPKAWTDGTPVTLKPASSPVGRFVFVLIFSGIWNGILSFFVVELARDLARGNLDLCTGLFILPFLIVGVLLLLWTVYAFLGLFNPKLELSVNSDAVAPGQPLDVAWSFIGRSTRVQRLRIVLTGAEEATYRRGTRTSTDRHTFCTLDGADVTDPLQIAQGGASLDIPADAMHSFASHNNKIVWTLKATGEIPGWPDVSEEFAVVVLPIGFVEPAAS